MDRLDKVLRNGIWRSVRNRRLQNSIREKILAGRGTLDHFFPSDFSEDEKEDIEPVVPFTMTSLERLISLSRAVDYLVQHKIAGDIVECGVWRGGSMMLVARRLLRQGDQHRNLFLFDTYEGMSEPGAEDVSRTDQKKASEILKASDRLQGNNAWCYSALEEVQSNLLKTNYPGDKLFFVKGKVEDTIPDPKVGNICLLRLDTDWYESTRHELNCLYDKLVTGGILIIDDYGHWSGSRKAVDEFVAERGLNLFFNRIDYTGRLAIKQQ